MIVYIKVILNSYQQWGQTTASTSNSESAYTDTPLPVGVTAANTRLVATITSSWYSNNAGNGIGIVYSGSVGYSALHFRMSTTKTEARYISWIAVCFF